MSLSALAIALEGISFSPNVLAVVGFDDVEEAAPVSTQPIIFTVMPTPAPKPLPYGHGTFTRPGMMLVQFTPGTELVPVPPLVMAAPGAFSRFISWNEEPSATGGAPPTVTVRFKAPDRVPSATGRVTAPKKKVAPVVQATRAPAKVKGPRGRVR
jgi:hypothetical protein